MNDPKQRAAWEERSRRDQADFMQNIAQRLGRPALTEAPLHPFRGAPDFWQRFELPVADRLELFAANWTAAGGHVVRLADMDEARRFIVDFCRETEAAGVVLQDQKELRGLELAVGEQAPKVTIWNTNLMAAKELAEAAAFADVGVDAADFAVAYTGTVVVRSGARQGRSTSLLPKAFIAVIPADKVVTRLGEVMGELARHRAGDDIPAGIHFISGPSRSADIENDLTIGVHGPGIVYALMIG